MEDRPPVTGQFSRQRFNPSGSMDYFGRSPSVGRCRALNWFQSFWVNGLLWKVSPNKCRIEKLIFVSILLGQWITLEALYPVDFDALDASFNPSGSMDYFGSFSGLGLQSLFLNVSILLGQWITLEERGNLKIWRCKAGFNPSGSMDYFGRVHQ